MKKLIFSIILAITFTKGIAQIVLINESFAGDTLPAGWSIDSAGLTPVNGWVFDNTPNVQPTNGFDTNFPGIPSTLAPSNARWDCNLSTPFFSTMGLSLVYLSYTDRVEITDSLTPGLLFAYAKIELSNDSGLTWQEIHSVNYPHYASKRNIFNISNEAAGYSYVKLRFHFLSNDDGAGEWCIDSVVIADSIPCINPPDSGITVSDVGFACSGEQVKLQLDDLSRGIGQTYQWQHKNSATGNVFVDLAGAVYDTLTHTQNEASYYQCLITCGGLTDNSTIEFVSDTPNVGRFDSKSYCLICPSCTDTLQLLPSYQNGIPIPIGGPGVVYQWQKKDSLNGVYVDILGATNDYYIVTAATYNKGTYFQCKQTCAATGYTRPISQWTWFYEMINPHPMCYCYPPTGSSCNFNETYIDNINITGTTFNYSDGCHDTLFAGYGYDNYSFHDPILIPNATATLKQGDTYTLNITQNNYLSANRILDFFIDYNQNIVFDSTERISIYPLQHGIPLPVNFTVPANAPSGQTGMRVRVRTSGGTSYYSACEPFGGTTEDYIITIDSTVGVAQLWKDNYQLDIYPNPANDVLAIKYSSKNKGIEGTCKVLDLIGKEILKQKINSQSQEILIDVSNFKPGVYFVHVLNRNGNVSGKFIKQ